MYLEQNVVFQEINRFLSVSVCDSLPLTRLEGLYDLRKQLEQYKDQMKDLLKIFQGTDIWLRVLFLLCLVLDG